MAFVLKISTVKTILSESALTSIDLLYDGKTVAVGSSRGKVYIYDLRHSNDPIFVKSAHKTSVACLRFQKSLFISEVIKQFSEIVIFLISVYNFLYGTSLRSGFDIMED